MRTSIGFSWECFGVRLVQTDPLRSGVGAGQHRNGLLLGPVRACKPTLPWELGFDEMSFLRPDATRTTLSKSEHWLAAGGKQSVINAMVAQRDFAATGGLTREVLNFFEPVC
jgi:hypothetical protein